jgi:Ca2+-binding EF-hand superfamily protein
MRQFDKDGDGKLSQEEAPERMKQHFAVIDADNDGGVSEDELAAALRRMRDRKGGSGAPDEPGTSAATPKRLFNDQDADADGRVSKSEAKGTLLDKFNDLDVNDDGQLDVLEVENGLAKKET